MTRTGVPLATRGGSRSASTSRSRHREPSTRRGRKLARRMPRRLLTRRAASRGARSRAGAKHLDVNAGIRWPTNRQIPWPTRSPGQSITDVPMSSTASLAALDGVGGPYVGPAFSEQRQPAKRSGLRRCCRLVRKYDLRRGESRISNTRPASPRTGTRSPWRRRIVERPADYWDHAADIVVTRWGDARRRDQTAPAAGGPAGRRCAGDEGQGNQTSGPQHLLGLPNRPGSTWRSWRWPPGRHDLCDHEPAARGGHAAIRAPRDERPRPRLPPGFANTANRPRGASRAPTGGAVPGERRPPPRSPDPAGRGGKRSTPDRPTARPDRRQNGGCPPAPGDDSRCARRCAATRWLCSPPSGRRGRFAQSRDGAGGARAPWGATRQRRAARSRLLPRARSRAVEQARA